MSNSPIEPSADLRMFANTMRQVYVALISEGFTTMEALTIIGQVIAGNSGGASK